MYKLKIIDLEFGQIKNVIQISDNASIPFDPANVDYQAYLAWLDEGNEPLPADELTSEV